MNSISNHELANLVKYHAEYLVKSLEARAYEYAVNKINRMEELLKNLKEISMELMEESKKGKINE